MYCKRCNVEIAENVKFCPNCGNQIQNIVVTKEATYRDDCTINHELKKCDMCGYSWLTGENICPNCGNDSQTKETFSVHDLMDKISKIDNDNLAITFADKMYQKLRGKSISKKDELKVNLIKFYPLPKTKNALYEFVIFSNANSKVSNAGNTKDIQSQTIIANAWKAKLEQSYNFAKLKYGNEADFIEIKRLYEDRKRKDLLSIIIPFAVLLGIPLFVIFIGIIIGILSNYGII